MNQRIRTTGPTHPIIQTVNPAHRRIEPAEVAKALGADLSTDLPLTPMAPLTLFGVREELFRRLHSTGGRPALSGTTGRIKIPLGEAERSTLERLAAEMAAPGFAPSVGQVASVLLEMTVRSMANVSNTTGSIAGT